uniref:ParB-like N-terminal domain-containing protein n=1 Tax=viral metagenome TaxID=1070528 RepID=A0A6H2A161_9ZZZZ
MKVKNIAIELIKYPPVVLRSPKDMTGIEDLAKSIETDGLLNPLTVMEKENYFELLAGGRRLQAIKLLQWKVVPCNILIPAIDRERIITLIENQKRADLNPLEEAQYYEYLQKEFGLSQEKIGELSGTTSAHVNQMLSLLSLDEYTMGALAAGDIGPSQARELGRCSDVGYRHSLVDIIKKSGASVLVLKRWVDERVGFISQAETRTGVLVSSPFGGGGVIGPVTCDICKGELHYGGLQAILCCNECYTRLKQVMESGDASQGRGEGQQGL